MEYKDKCCQITDITGHIENGKQFDLEIANATNEMRMKQSRYNFLVETEKEKEGYSRAVKSILLECEKDLKGGTQSSVKLINNKYLIKSNSPALIKAENEFCDLYPNLFQKKIYLKLSSR